MVRIPVETSLAVPADHTHPEAGLAALLPRLPPTTVRQAGRTIKPYRLYTNDMAVDVKQNIPEIIR
jgi:hypothetical protein